MELLGQLLACQLIQDSHLHGEDSGGDKTLGKEHILADDVHVWFNHDYRSEKRFKVIWKFRTTLVSRIHGTEDTTCLTDDNIAPLKVNPALGNRLAIRANTHRHTLKDNLDLLGDNRQHGWFDTIELVKANPATRLAST